MIYVSYLENLESMPNIYQFFSDHKSCSAFCDEMSWQLDEELDYHDIKNKEGIEYVCHELPYFIAEVLNDSPIDAEQFGIDLCKWIESQTKGNL